MAAYYNEIDPIAAAWLRNLIIAGHIAPGEVDQRSIEDVRPDDLRGFTQCHFFAGVGVWSYALRRAGVADSTRIWTGSCPCQPFSAAGKGDGFADERHLWPAWHHLIAQCEPAVLIGEQVASVAVDPWIDLVQTDMEALGYAVGAVPFPSAGVGAPHIRDRCYWVADATGRRLAWQGGSGTAQELGTPKRGGQLLRLEQGTVGGVADAARGGFGELGCPVGARDLRHADFGGDASGGLADPEQRPGGCEAAAADHGQPQTDGPADRAGGCCGAPCGVADAAGEQWSEGGLGTEGKQQRALVGSARLGAAGRAADQHGEPGAHAWPGPTNGQWRAADWLLCRDGKWRPVEPGTFPLAHGAPARVGRLRAYGNAINAEAAVEFIRAAGLV